MAKSFFNRAALEAIHKECLDLGERKNRDYGGVRDTIADNGVVGVVTRMDDKQARLLSLIQPGHIQAVKDEGLRDTLLDVINYATYAVSLLDGTWGKKPGESLGEVMECAKILWPSEWNPSTHSEEK